MYTIKCCGMIAVKREVVACQQWQAGFPWSECQVRKLTTSHCTSWIVCRKQKRRVISSPGEESVAQGLETHTGECTVTACRTKASSSLVKVRKGGDFFYGKSSNEDYTEGL